jgi:hypothetical protein
MSVFGDFMVSQAVKADKEAEELRQRSAHLRQQIIDVARQRDDLLLALEELLDARPTGFGNDRRLNEACLQAERAIDGARR